MSAAASQHKFHTQLALLLTLASFILLGILSTVYSPETSDGRKLEENNNGNDDGQQQDYSAYSCSMLYEIVPDAGDNQCNFARNCNQGEGVWAPFVFCSSYFSTKFLCWVISPIIVVWMVVLFRLLGSTAEDYFSPSLEMFSVRLGLPPRFAGVTLLALGNGAADVSATISAITGDAKNGYQLSLGALSGAAMVIGGVVAAFVILVAEGVPCRGALVRDAIALLVTISVVWSQLASGIVGPNTITLFLAIYVVFVVLVLVADVYHRAVVLPRLRLVAQQQERERQLEEERFQRVALNPELLAESAHRNPIGSVLAALSNYDNANNEGWGVESQDLAADRPVMLHGSHGILHGESHVGVHQDMSYSMLENMVDRACVEPGNLAPSASNWSGALYDGRQEVSQHAKQVWEDIIWNGDIDIITKVILILELPFTVLRKVTIPIPCEGYYVRGLIALAIAASPIWLAYYLSGYGVSVVTNGGWVYFLILLSLSTIAAAFVLRFAPGGDGNMSLLAATPIALYGFIIAATWIDTIADALVSLLAFIGIILRIPGPVVGLTILAWGNSSADLSANVTMARKGLANMAMTACFAGPVFNILVGLGLGFSSLAAQTGQLEFSVSLSPSVTAGFAFVVLNTVSILGVGLFWGKGFIPKQYGYVALTLYAIYAITSIALQYLNE